MSLRRMKPALSDGWPRQIRAGLPQPGSMIARKAVCLVTSSQGRQIYEYYSP